MTQHKDHNSSEHENLCWLDLETTGLRANDDAILELGIVITDKNLRKVAEQSWLVKPSKNVPITEIDPYVFNMHNKSGLWEECFGVEATWLDSAERSAMQFIQNNGAQGSPLCGNTISFDRAFLKAQAPALLTCLHYRNIDVSTLKNVMKMHFPDVPPFVPSQDAAHRVLSDLNTSIAEYGYYLNIIKNGVHLRD